MLWSLAVGLAVYLAFKVFIQRNPPPKYGVYAQQGKWFYVKKALFMVMFYLRRRRNGKLAGNDKKGSLDQGTGYGVQSHVNVSDMEKPQTLEKHEHALDAVYFNGMDKNGTFFVLRIGRRHNRRAEIWLSLNIPEVGFLQSPLHPDTAVYNTDGRTFSAAGLRLECLEPMRRWKISFNGLLRRGLHNDWTPDREDLVHVKFSFIWEAFSDVFNFDTDLDTGLVADAIARETWTQEFWDRLRGKHQTHYEQWGEMWGTFHMEGEDRHISLRGTRDHSYGIRDWRTFHRYVVHFGYLEDGTAFHVSNVSLPITTSYLQVGYVSMPCGVMHAVSWMDIDLTELGENGDPPQVYNFNFIAGGKKYHVTVSGHVTPKYYLHDNWGTMIMERMCDFTVNGVKGYGITEFLYRHEGGNPVPVQDSLPLLAEANTSQIEASECTALVLPFTASGCTSSSLVGGKGCQLALLTQLNSQDFTVPSGFCLTIEAFKYQLKEHSKLQDTITQLQKIASQQTEGNLQEMCSSVVELFKQTGVCNTVQEAIESQLKELFADTLADKMFAVRSSAAGEDGAEMSGAGQMDTFLGMKGLNQITESVAKCWASHFAFQAVEYRRQHGQPIKSSMGVVIQEMVKSESSGVLFTQDPLTNNPGLMLLNANYGLGESVVSGSSEPDTITLSRSWDGEIKVIQKVVGSKKTQINVTGSGGTEETKVDGQEAEKICLPDKLALQLAHIGLELEKRFSDPRDIEWAVRDGHIYLLQARPITTLGLESEWELMHEFDSPLATDTEVLTNCNIGEMMPAAMTPLTISTFFRGIEIGVQKMAVSAGVLPNTYDLHKFNQIRCNHGFINILYMDGLSDVHVLGSDKRMAELSVMGEVQEQITVEDIKQYWGQSNLLQKLINSIGYYRYMNSAVGKVKEIEQTLKLFCLMDYDTAEDMYQAIDENMDFYYKGWIDTILSSAQSGAWSTVLMSVLSQGRPEWTTEHYSDVAMLLSTCEDVYSADVPSALQDLAACIHDQGKAEEFTKRTPLEAVSWLKSSAGGAICKKYKAFLSRHGHRCIREAEFRTKSWQSEPTKFVQVLQAMLAVPQRSPEKRPELGVKESIAKVKSSLTTVGRYVLHWALPKARKAVGTREWGKSVSIQVVEAFKQPYWKLAKLMVHEGFIPDEDLLFFFTHKEIRQVLRERSGRLIAKAQKRRRIHPKMMDLKFPRINTGHPIEIPSNCPQDDFVITSVKLKGMPVSQGMVRGTARVVTSLQDAGNIQAGDVLVVNYTDVGWTPYFPLISGLVTEIGGLLSHGAVVAREYGLPCVVNVPRATMLITSGDQVILDGTKGTLEKVE